MAIIWKIIRIDKTNRIRTHHITRCSWILGATLKDRKRNDDICRIIGVVTVLQTRYASPGWDGMVKCSGGKMTTVPSESWRQTSVDNGATVDNGKHGSTSSGTIWRSCDSRRWKQRIMLNGEGETVWLTRHQRDLQPEGDRETLQV